MDALSDLPGVTPRVVPDPTGNPLDRLQVEVDPAELGANAATVARVLAECDPAIIVRNHEVELGFFQLDPCNLKAGQAEVVADSLRSVLTQRELLQARPEDADAARNGSTRAYLRWGADTA